MLISSFGKLFMIPDLSCCCVENLAFYLKFFILQKLQCHFSFILFNITINALSKYIPIHHDSNIFWISFVNVKTENRITFISLEYYTSFIYFMAWNICQLRSPCLKIKLKMTSSIYLGVRKKINNYRICHWCEANVKKVGMAATT